MITSAWSILAETEEPTVLTPIFWNWKEPEPMFWQNWNPSRNRNQISEPRVTETAFLANFTDEITQICLFWMKFIQFHKNISLKKEKHARFRRNSRKNLLKFG